MAGSGFNKWRRMMIVGEFALDTDSDETHFDLSATYSLNGDGVVECSSENKNVVDHFNRHPAIYMNTDIDGEHPIMPSDGIKYLEALISEQRTTYSHYKEI